MEYSPRGRALDLPLLILSVFAAARFVVADTSKLFTKHLDDARISSASSKLVFDIRRYSLCTQSCLSEYGNDCTYVNYHESNGTCEISGDALQENAVTHDVVPGWTSYHTYQQDWHWDLVFKGTKLIQSSVRDLWVGSSFTASPTRDQLRLYELSSAHYKAEKVENWEALNIVKVKFSFWKNGQEVMKVVLDGQGTTKTNFFSKSRILEDQWSDLTTTGTCNIFSIDGGGVGRRFMINHSYGGCSGDTGWVNVVDSSGGGCDSWDKMSTWPNFAYSTADTALNYGNNWGSNVAFADIMAIHLRYA